ncbi:MAG: nucleoside hydrolase, partial [Micrococcales bacterium]|nr:nucleoside hydrolase [Micrococcales bacterium]
ILEAAGATQVPVAMGMSVPLSGHHNPKEAEDLARQDLELPGPDQKRLSRRSPEHGVDLMVDAVLSHPGEVTLIAVGPLTNVAMAVLKEPLFVQAVGRLVILGGAFGFEPTYGRGNITPVAELNIWNDPLAAEIVFQSGIPITVTNLDVSNPKVGTVLHKEQLQALTVVSQTSFARFFGQMVQTYIDRPKFDLVEDGCVLYDPTAVAAVLDPSLISTVQCRVEVQTGPGPAYGQTVAYPDPSGNVAVACAIDSGRFIDLFTKRITTLLQTT